MRLLRWKITAIFTIFLLAVLILMPVEQTWAATGKSTASEKATAQSQASQESGQQLDHYDFSGVDDSLDIDVDFKDMVQKIITGGTDSVKQNFFGQIITTITKELQSNRVALVQILALSVIAAIFTNITASFKSTQISDMGFFVTCLALITILLAVFTSATNLSKDAISCIIKFMKSLIPIYFSSIAATSGSLTTVAYYEVILMVITLINSMFLHVVITGSYIYVIVSIADCISKEESLSKLCDLIKTVLTWIVKTSLAAVIGINAIQSLILPVADSMKTSVLSKSLSMIPGIGGGVGSISTTVIGAGTLIKNGIGVAALVVVIGICLVPIIKLLIFVLTYKFVSAIIQPISDKRIVQCINNLSEGIGILLMTVAYSAIMFIITIAIICASTNVNYLSL